MEVDSQSMGAPPRIARGKEKYFFGLGLARPWEATHTLNMNDQSHKVPNIAALAREMGVEYTHLYWVLHGREACSVSYAKEIERATGGKLVWTSFFQDAPAPGRKRVA